MKNLIAIICFLFIVIELVSCNKSGINSNYIGGANNNSIVGNWQIINDLSSITNSLNGFNNHLNYIGVSGDFYNFTSDSNLYIKKANSLDTGKYSTIADNKIQIIMFSESGVNFGTNGAIRGIFTITNLTSKTLTLTLSGSTPEGQELEVINLKK